jgi:hypothetical protein
MSAGRPLVAVRKTSDLAIFATVQPIAAAASAAVRVPASNSSTVKRSPSTAWTLMADGAVAVFIVLTKRTERPLRISAAPVENIFRKVCTGEMTKAEGPSCQRSPITRNPARQIAILPQSKPGTRTARYGCASNARWRLSCQAGIRLPVSKPKIGPTLIGSIGTPSCLRPYRQRLLVAQSARSTLIRDVRHRSGGRLLLGLQHRSSLRSYKATARG